MRLSYKKFLPALALVLIAWAHGTNAWGQTHRPTAKPDSLRSDKAISLKSVTVTGKDERRLQMKTSQSLIQLDKDYMQSHFAGSLMQTIEDIPGVKAMNIGAGQSKPAIRGLGFNRMLVTENGIKHEGQQWGEDHGLEIDQFAVDRLEVVKGPGALLYGSDAIGGVINLYSNYVPVKPFAANVSLFTRTVNQSYGISSAVQGRHDHWYYNLHLTYIDQADFKTTADSIQYYSYYIPLKNRQMRNTAGKEADAALTIGYKNDHWRSYLRVADIFNRSGFFANAHGLEVRLSEIDYDKSDRDIQLPDQQVNHLSIMQHTSWTGAGKTIEGELAFQQNHRMERSEPVSHGYMPKPNDPNEREFLKNTYTAHLRYLTQTSEKNQIKAGINAEYQVNKRSGWGFIIPDFTQFATGAYLYDRYAVTPQLIFNAGMRYDYAHTHIKSYKDWYTTPTDQGEEYLTRAVENKRNFNSITWSAGVNYQNDQLTLKANIGKSFRIPIPKELGVNGINYHIFRFEKGNPNLNPEQSYQADLSLAWENSHWHIQADPYINYFPNYIYLNPSPAYHEGMQLSEYVQARVLRYGCELQAEYHLTPFVALQAKGEYLKAMQQSGDKRGYSIPFSPPPAATLGAKYMFGDKDKNTDGYIALSTRMVASKKAIVPPEIPTPGYVILNFNAGKTCKIGKNIIKFTLNGNNLTNRRYYDHTSYYRLIGVPEPGRNFSLMGTLYI